MAFRGRTPRTSPVRVRLAEWGNPTFESLERTVATVALVLREGLALDSQIIGKLPAGGETFVLDEQVLGSITRCLITATAATASPLGWVTAQKDGQQLLVPCAPRQAAAGSRGALHFYTSHRLPEPSSKMRLGFHNSAPTHATHAKLSFAMGRSGLRARLKSRPPLEVTL